MGFFEDVSSVKVAMRLLLTFAFAGSLFVVVDIEAYKKLNKFLTKEYGLTKRIIPAIETAKISVEDFVVKNRKFFGSMFLVASFVLLTLY